MKHHDIPTIKKRENTFNFACGTLLESQHSPDSYNQYFFREIFRAHRLDFYLWFLCLQGTSRHKLDFADVELKQGQAIFMRPHQAHQIEQFLDCDGIFVVWRDEFLLQSPNCPALPSIQVFDAPQIQSLMACFELLQMGLALPDRHLQVPFLQAQLTAFLLYLQSLFQPALPKMNASYARFLAFQDLLETHFAQHRQVQFYAHELSCSPKTLNLTCQNYAHQTAKTVIDQRVLLEAKRLLVHTPLSINKIAERLGFLEGTHFAKFFKQYENLTANRFREKFAIR